jgi:hypothetical protein
MNAEIKQKMRDGRAKKCTVVEQKLNKQCEWSGKKMHGGRAEIKPKMPDGRAKKCTVVEQKLNKKCEMVGHPDQRIQAALFIVDRAGGGTSCA